MQIDVENPYDDVSNRVFPGFSLQNATRKNLLCIRRINNRRIVRICRVPVLKYGHHCEYCFKYFMFSATYRGVVNELTLLLVFIFGVLSCKTSKLLHLIVLFVYFVVLIVSLIGIMILLL